MKKRSIGKILRPFCRKSGIRVHCFRRWAAHGARCEKCYQSDLEFQRNRYQRRKKTGLCVKMKPSLTPLLETISHLNKQIYLLDKAIESTAQNRYPETIRLRQISGVGPITALQYVLTIGDPGRFAHSRDVPAYLGLTPRRHQSGSVEQQLRISKAGNKQLRTLLVQCAQYLLGCFGPDSDLKRWGTRMFERGGKNSKKRAIVAVARKLAVILHRLWITGDTYHPLYNVTANSATV